MTIFKCKMCGGTLEFNPGDTVAVCDSCGTRQTLPKLDDDRRANLYDRANHFRRSNEYDKATGIYEQILTEDNTDAEAYWSLVLCRYGIEYVEDPAIRKRVPTVNRAQFTSIFDDANYKSSLHYADAAQREVYEAEAKAINEIQKGILAISQKEQPFDVFICYKETDTSGRRTPDSVLANDLYHQLTQEGFKVFFARITLEDKLGTAYEPYIFAALNSAKVMVVLGTKPEYFNAVWVKNEWSRYLALVKTSGGRKLLIPAYKDMDPYDLPEEFSHLQAQDMGKLGFMQDLIRGIKKIVPADAPVQETVVATNGNPNTASLLKRAFMFLEDGNFDEADEYCEKVLDIDPENAQAYLGKLMAELRVETQDRIKNAAEPFDGSNNYQKICRFDAALGEQLNDDIAYINERNENTRLAGIYNDAVNAMNAADTEEAYRSAADKLQAIDGFKDANALAEKCLEQAEICRKDSIYHSAKSKMTGEKSASYEEARKMFQTISGWKDADEQICTCQRKIEEIQAREEDWRLKAERKAEEARIAAEEAVKKRKCAIAIGVPICTLVFLLVTVILPSHNYNKAVTLMEAGQYEEAIAAFEALGDYKDCAEQIAACEASIEASIHEQNYDEAVALMEAEQYEEAIPIFEALGDYKDSTKNLAACKISFLAPRRAASANVLSAGFWHTVGLKPDGTVVAVGYNEYGQCNVDSWTDIVAISAELIHTIGLKSDGTVVATGSNDDGQCNVDNWTDIVAVSAGYWHTVGLKSDGTVVAAGSNEYGQCNVDSWTDIVAVSAGGIFTIGLKSDGTVVVAGSNNGGDNWSNIMAVSAGCVHTIGLKSDGTVIASGPNDDGQCDVYDWTDIAAVSADASHTVGLKSDGTVVAVGSNEYSQCDTYSWTDIVAVSAGYGHTVGLTVDGIVVTAGSNEYGECNVSGWYLRRW